MVDPLLQGRRILVVEDEAIIAMMIQDMLEEFGCELAGIAARPAEALATIDAAERIDAAILDINLNGENSFGIAARLQERAIPFVFTTGYGERGLTADFTGARVLAKPFQQGQLEQSLREMVAEMPESG